jgi:hypothetical protein
VSCNYLVVYTCDACGRTEVVPQLDFEASTREHYDWFVMKPVDNHWPRHACSAQCRSKIGGEWATYRAWQEAHTSGEKHRAARRRGVQWRREETLL